jgi:hypothetical protein
MTKAISIQSYFLNMYKYSRVDSYLRSFIKDYSKFSFIKLHILVLSIDSYRNKKQKYERRDRQ